VLSSFLLCFDFNPDVPVHWRRGALQDVMLSCSAWMPLTARTGMLQLLTGNSETAAPVVGSNAMSGTE